MRAWKGGCLATAAACVAVGLSGCGTSDRDLIRNKVDQFARAVAHRDAATLCRQVWAPSLLAHLTNGGISCRQAMQVFFGTVHAPQLSIGRVDIHGSSASAIVLTTAAGQEASIDAIELIRTGKGWRVSSLGTPTVTGATK
jgi:hypothetical protein